MYKNDMTEDERDEFIITHDLDTDAGRKALADSMVEPVRCGGMEYGDGIAYIWHGGYPYPSVALSAARELADGQWPERWADAYRRLNNKFGYSNREPQEFWKRRKELGIEDTE